MSPFRQKVLFLYILLFVFVASTLVSAYSYPHRIQSKSIHGKRRLLLELQDDDDEQVVVVKKKPSSSSVSTKIISGKNSTKLVKSDQTKNQTKLAKATTAKASDAIKNQTKLIKPDSNSSKNKTKVTKTSSDSTKDSFPKPKSNKLNSTSTSNSSTKATSQVTKNNKSSSDLASSKNSKTTTTKPTDTKQTKPKSAKKQSKWIGDVEDNDDDDDDLVSEFRDLPSKFQQTIMPDFQKISKTSRSYLTQYNKEFTKGFKPYVGNKYASTIASFVSFAFIIIPLILVSLIFNRIKAYFSLQKLLIFIQIYLAIYFSILCFSSLVTGLEPLRFFYSTSQSTYVCVQVLQTLAYVLYLLLLLMYLVLVFSTETGLATKMLGLGQTFVGFAVGLHYYMTVFHRAVLRQPPKTSWKVDAIYATCFVVICLLGRVDRSKKAYLEDGGEEGKKS